MSVLLLRSTARPNVPGPTGLSALAAKARRPQAQIVGKQSRTLSRQQRLVRAVAQRRQAKRNRLLGYGAGLVIMGLLVATVADRAPDKVLAFDQALFARQPEEGGKGLDDARLADLARGAGVPQEVVDAFAARTFEPWIGQVTEKAFASGINSTPTVKVDGVVFKGDLLTAGPLAEAINAAKGRP
jgi:hypothetical protein